MFNFHICICQRIQYLPHDGNSPKGVHAAEQARNEDQGRKQNRYRKQQHPDQEQRNPETESTTLLIAQAHDGNKRNHFNASISRIASSAVICPCRKRSKISALEGVGLVSTNSRLSAIRVRRDLIVG